jgi:hypothetical protein
MFFGLLIAPFRGRRAHRSERALSGSRLSRAARKHPLKLHWLPGNDGHPRSHWVNDGEKRRR